MKAPGTFHASGLQLLASAFAVRRWIAALGAAAGVALAYYLAARLGLALLSPPSDVAVFWPASGMAAGIFILSKRRFRPAIAVGVIIGTVAANLMSDRHILTSLLKGMCNAGEAAVVAGFIEYSFGRPFAFDDLKRVLGFVAAACLGAAASALGGAATMTLFHSAAPYWNVWRAWFLSDGVGIVMVAPLVIGLGQAWRRPAPRAPSIEAAGVLSLLTLILWQAVAHPSGSWLSFDADAVVLPFLLWLVARCEPIFGIAGAFIVSISVTYATIFGIGHFGDAALPLAERVNGAQLVIVMVTLFTLTLVALFAERRQKEATLRMALDGAELGAFNADFTTGHFVCDARVARMHGYNAPPNTIKEIRRFVHRDDLKRIDDAFANSQATGGAWNAEYRVIPPPSHSHAGETRWVAVESSVVRNAQGLPASMRGVTRDITDRKRAEQALAESSAQHELASKIGQVGSFTIDLVKSRVQLSPGCASILGLPEGTLEITRDEARKLVHPDDLAQFDATRDQAFVRGEGEFRAQFRILRADSSEPRWIEGRSIILYDQSGQPVRLNAVVIDFTERKQTEALLSESKDRLADAMTAGRVVAFEWDAVTDLSQRSDNAADILGFAQNGLAGPPGSVFLGRINPDDQSSLRKCIRALRPGKPSYVLSFRYARPDGSEVWLEETAKGEFSATGRLLRIKGLTRDVTERKHAEERQRVLLAELDHRVKNVLATVSTVAARTMDASSSMDHFVASLDGRIRSMARTHELLSAAQWQGISVLELVRRELAPYMSKGNTEINGPDVMLKAEVGQAVGMVLHELATNAAKHGALSTQNGRVSIQWQRRLNGHSGPILVLDWREAGGPSVVTPQNPGFGTTTIRDLIPYEFGGMVDLKFSAAGVQCRLELPADWLVHNSEPVS